MTTNADRLREGIEAFNRRDFDTTMEGFHPEIEWEVSTDLGPDPTVYRGHAGVRAFWDTWLDTMDDFRLEILECVQAGDGRVFVATRATGRGKGSGAQVAGELHQVFEYRDELAVRATMFGSRASALAAAGLSEA